MSPRRISLYIHVPFCKRRCSYCTFYHIPHVDDFEEAFVGALLDELAAGRRQMSFVCPTVFFGGGTPSVLTERSLDKIFDVVADMVTDGAEITFETNPEDVSDDLVQGLARRGVNRISLGIQSMSAPALVTLKRCNPSANERAVEIAKRHFTNVSMDVLVGIPGASVRELEDTLDFVGRHNPPHVSLYCLEPGGVMMKDVASFFDGVDPERSAGEYLLACRILESRGYEHYEVSNFALPGFECRHNHVYWSGDEYLGVGPGAHSFIDGRRFHNAPSIERYVEGPGAPRGRVRVDGERGAPARRLETLMLALRTSRGLELDGQTAPDDEIRALVAGGLASSTGGRLRLTDRGFLLLDEIVLRLGAATPSQRPSLEA